MEGPKTLTLGEKIKKFRKRSGKNQMEIELEVGLAPGSLSRIEADKVNPTKETLVKLVEALNLKSYDAITLFNLNLGELSNVLKISGKLLASFDEDLILQTAVNEIAYELNLLAAFINLKSGEYVYAKTFTQTFFTRIANEIIGKQFSSLKIKQKNHPENLVVKTIENSTSFLSNKLSDFSTPFIPLSVSNLLQVVTTVKTLKSYPLRVNDECIGCITFGKNYLDDFSFEDSLLIEFSNQLAKAIFNARQIQEKLHLSI